jgi:outer membrane protein assembly factor BamB
VRSSRSLRRPAPAAGRGGSPLPPTWAARRSRAASSHLDLDGTLYGLDTRTGKTLWQLRAGIGANSCPTLAGDELLATLTTRVESARVLDLVAFAPKR